MSTSSGYIMVVHDFDINTIADDLNGFKVREYNEQRHHSFMSPLRYHLYQPCLVLLLIMSLSLHCSQCILDWECMMFIEWFSLSFITVTTIRLTVI